MRHGSQLDPPNRFESTHRVRDLEHQAWDTEYLEGLDQRQIEYLPDATQSIVASNDSPDIPFRYSINPYRGCVHACAYCFARPSHEYLGMNAGLDFETKIMVKHQAPALLRKHLSKPNWQGDTIIFSGVTDCYQPAEREFRLTRGCLEVALEFSQSISIITKNALVCRDLDLLAPLAQQQLASVNVSLTTLDAKLAREMEPRTSTPAARLRAIEQLSAANVPVRVMVAPIIPGVNDTEIPALLKAARNAGAQDASYVLLRLPLTVEPVFREWLERVLPQKAAKVESLLRQMHQGKLYQAKWRQRQTGQGEIASQIGAIFQVFYQKLGYNRLPPHDISRFRPTVDAAGQMRLL